VEGVVPVVAVEDARSSTAAGLSGVEEQAESSASVTAPSMARVSLRDEVPCCMDDSLLLQKNWKADAHQR
jgi:hypothetical protein